MADLTKDWYGNFRTLVTATKDYATEQFRSWSWKNTSREILKQVRETFDLRTTASVVAVLITVTAGIHIASTQLVHTQVAYKIMIDGKYAGTVADLDRVKNELNALPNDSHHVVSWTAVRVSSKDLLDDTSIASAIDQAAHNWVKAVGIRVNGRVVAYVQDLDTAKSLLEQVKLKLASPQGTVDSIKFDQSISFETKEMEKSQVFSLSDAIDALVKGTEQPKPYIVSRGDSLWSIAATHNLNLSDLKSMNPSIVNENSLKEGQELIIDKHTPLLTVQSVEKVDRTVDIPFDTQYQDDPNMDEGQTRVIQEGITGQKQQTVQLTKENGVVIQTQVLSETVIKDKTDQIVARGTRPTALPYASGDWIWPTTTHYVSSPFGEWRGREAHPGIDLAGPTGSPIYASNSGTVIFAGYDSGGYGNCVRISHGNGIVTVYGHMSAIYTSVGKTVAKGQQIGAIGMTGEATGPHLHYEVRLNGIAVNPAPYM